MSRGWPLVLLPLVLLPATSGARPPRPKAPAPPPVVAPAPPPDRGPVEVRLRKVSLRRDPVRFTHAAHLGYAGVGDCTSCHHRGTGSGPHPPCTACHETREQAEKAFHGQCKGCHKAVADAGPKRPPTNCAEGGCHGKLVLAREGARQPPVPYDHYRHRVTRAPDDCRRCHHADPPDTVPRACTPCHARDLEAVFHKTCIGCHVEAAQGRPGTPATRCSFCHAGT